MTASSEELSELDRSLLVHPFLPDTSHQRQVFTSGKGSWLTDATGRNYLDCTGGLWLAHVGHGRAELASAAAGQMAKLEYSTLFWNLSNEPAILLAKALIERAPAGIDKVFYTSGGSEGIDSALKMARLFHHRAGSPERTWILARERGYHGVAYGGGTATGMGLYKAGMGPMLPNVTHLSAPWPYRPELYGGEDCVDYCVAELEQKIAELGAENIAAFVGEPIMGVAGMIPPPAGYWERIQEVLHRNGILLILDEVVTAFGRTGYWFAAEKYGISPDIIVTAKGITSGYFPLGAVLVSSRVASALESEGGFPLGYTYGGHPTGCAVALRNLQLIEEEGLLERAVTSGNQLLKLLQPLLDMEVVGEIRQVGMMFGIELVEDKETRVPLRATTPTWGDVLKDEFGVIVRCAENRIVFSPPLTMTNDELEILSSALVTVIGRLDPLGWKSKSTSN